MESINPQINALHSAHCSARNLVLDLRPTQERWYHDALKAGITPDMLYEVIKHRQRRILAGVRREESVYIRNLVGSEEAIDNLLEEAAMLASRKRIRVMPPDQASVMRTTGRSDQVPDKPAQHVSDALLSALKQAAQ